METESNTAFQDFIIFNEKHIKFEDLCYLNIVQVNLIQKKKVYQHPPKNSNAFTSTYLTRCSEKQEYAIDINHTTTVSLLSQIFTCFISCFSFSYTQILTQHKSCSIDSRNENGRELSSLVYSPDGILLSGDDMTCRNGKMNKGWMTNMHDLDCNVSLSSLVHIKITSSTSVSDLV